MKKITINHVQFGFEASSDSLLKKMQKKHRFIHNIQALKCAEEQNLVITGLNIIRGIPSELKSDIIKSIVNLKFLRYLLNKYHLSFQNYILFKEAPFFNDIPPEERKNWSFHVNWSEEKNINFISKVDRFDFYGFERDELKNSKLWEFFYQYLEGYKMLNWSYDWIEYPDGSSEIREDNTYFLNKIKTEILKYCDTIKTINDLNFRFSHISQKDMNQILFSLKTLGFLYIDDSNQKMISIVSTKYLDKI
jgi:radical SAM superfamily enzyme YgiQ (UPF0313 family)